jgi:inhibitor of cysteine peptidase
MACAQQPDTSKSAPPAAASEKAQKAEPQTIAVEATDDGKQLTLKRGAILLVRLEANPSTGYSWAVIGDPAPLVFVSSEYEPAKPNQQLAGAPEMQVMRFTANLAGSVELKLGYRRPWKKGVAPAKTFHVAVTVPEGPLQ